MGKKKAAIKEPENHDISPITSVNGLLPKPSHIPRPKSSCSTALASVILIALLSFIIGLIFLELDKSNRDLNENLQKYHSTLNEEKLAEKLAEKLKASISKEKDFKAIPSKPPPPPPPTPPSTPPSTPPTVAKEKLEEKEKKSPKEKVKDPVMDPGSEPPPKKIKTDETIDPKVSSARKEKDSMTKQKEIEKQIVSDKPIKSDKESDKDKIMDVSVSGENVSDKKSSSESKEEDKVEGEKIDISKSKKEKEADSSLEDLYIEVETIAEEILKEDPENAMVKQLAPHLEGVLRDLEGGKLSGLRDSLLHIKLILTDLKERLAASRKDKKSKEAEASAQTPKPGEETKHSGSSSKDKDGRVPVDEVIPDPIYIAPLGDKDKDSEDKKPVKSKKDVSPSEQKVPVDEVIPDPIYIKPLGEAEKDSTAKQSSEGKQSQTQKPVDKPQLQKTEDKPKQSQKVEAKSRETQLPEDKSRQKKETENKPSQSQRTEDKPSHVQGTEDKPNQSQRTEDKPSQIKKTEDKPSQSLKTEDKPSHSIKTEDKPPSQSHKSEEKPSSIQKTDDKPSQTIKSDDKPNLSQKTEDKSEHLSRSEDKLSQPQKTNAAPSSANSQARELDEQEQKKEETNRKESHEFKDSEHKKKKTDKSYEERRKSEENLQMTVEVGKAFEKLKIDKTSEEVKSEIKTEKQKPNLQTEEKIKQAYEGEPDKKNEQSENKKSATEKVSDIKQHKEKIGESKEEKETKKQAPMTQDKIPSNKLKDVRSDEKKVPVSSSSASTTPSKSSKISPSEAKKEAELEDKIKIASVLEDENLIQALNVYNSLVQELPKSPRVLFRRAKVIDKLADLEKSNIRLEQAIEAYLSLLELADDVPLEILKEAGLRCADRMNFRGRSMHAKKKKLLRQLSKIFMDDASVLNQVGIFYLQMNSNEAATKIFRSVLQILPDDGFAMAHLGFVLKLESKNETDLLEASRYLAKGINSHAEGVEDTRLYYHLGDAYQRLGQMEKAYELFDEGARNGMFRSRYQRSTYNVDRLTSRPLWTPEETTYQEFFQKIQSHWTEIRKEGLLALDLNKENDSNIGFRKEAENLREKGDWEQFELYVRGKRNVENCKIAKVTCSLVEDFHPASRCKRGQIKFSVMMPGTHVYPHTGPTNCRLRSHLGLVTPEGPRIRVGNETLEWKAGNLFIFDDSFEHEVWHDGKSIRLILIIDVWHPELTEHEKSTLNPI